MVSVRPVRPLGEWSGALTVALAMMAFGVFLEVFTPYVVAFTTAPGRPLYLLANGSLIAGSLGLLVLLGSHVLHTAVVDD